MVVVPLLTVLVTVPLTVTVAVLLTVPVTAVLTAADCNGGCAVDPFVGCSCQ